MALPMLLVLASGIGVRYLAARDYLWLDETHTRWVVTGTLADVATRAADGNQTPLYFYAVKAVTRLSGDSAMGLRAASLLSGALVLIVLPWAIWKFTRSFLATLLIAIWLAGSGTAVYYSSEARPYVLVQLLGILQAVWFYRWTLRWNNVKTLRQSRAWFDVLAIGLLSAAIIYTHVTGAWLLVAEVIFVLALMVARRPVPLMQCIVSAVGFLFLIAPVFLMLAPVWQRRGNWASVTDPAAKALSMLFDVGVYLLLPLVILAADWWWKKSPQEEDVRRCERTNDGWLPMFISIWALVPSIMIVGLDMLGIAPLAIGRYAIVGAIAWPLFAALMVSRMKSVALKLIVSVAVVAYVISDSPVVALLSGESMRNENWRDAVAAIAEADDDSPVLLAANVLEDEAARRDRSPRFQRYLAFPVFGMAPELPNPVLPVQSHGTLIEPNEADRLRQHRTAWVVIRDYPQNADLNATAIANAFGDGEVAVEQAMFESPSPNFVQLFRLRFEGTDPK